MRPLFCYWGWRGFGGPDAATIVVAAASLELFHAFALIHDDIVDRSERRRARRRGTGRAGRVAAGGAGATGTGGARRAGGRPP
ncbi:polyprenyl synthetase family protein [Micromonospora aurantiaca (nom. illeg.)]|uniref:polyprenyl synthetase family protein n=1 Tax=Micromonospora aurantiaca (nom. illeg.) TaxID=47850 RepID=UPI0033D996B3